ISSRLYSSSGSSWLRSAGAAGGVHGCGISAVEGATLWLVMADPSGECFDNSTYLVFWVWNGSGTSSKFCNQLVLIVVDSDVIDSGAAIFGSAVANCSELVPRVGDDTKLTSTPWATVIVEPSPSGLYKPTRKSCRQRQK